MADIAKLAPAFAKLAEAAQEISDIFAGAGGVRQRALCAGGRGAHQE